MGRSLCETALESHLRHLRLVADGLAEHVWLLELLLHRLLRLLMLGLEVLGDLLARESLGLVERLGLRHLLAHRLHLLLHLISARSRSETCLIRLEEVIAACVSSRIVLRLHLLHPHGLLMLLLLQLDLDLLLHDGLLLLEVLSYLLVDLPVGALLQVLLVHYDLLLL